MAFEQFIPLKRGHGLGVTVTKHGQFLFSSGLLWRYPQFDDTLVEVQVDKANHCIAIKRSSAGEFRLKRMRETCKTLMLQSKALKAYMEITPGRYAVSIDNETIIVDLSNPRFITQEEEAK